MEEHMKRNIISEVEWTEKTKENKELKKIRDG
jgi:hypothetical protein